MKTAIFLGKKLGLPKLGDFYSRIAHIYFQKKDLKNSAKSIEKAIEQYKNLGSDWNLQLEKAIKFKQEINLASHS